MLTTEAMSRAMRNRKRSMQAQLGRSTHEAVWGLFTWDPRVVSELLTLPSVVVTGQSSTSQLPDGTFPLMLEIDGLDESGLG
jgi:hypothetical protein